ncbi:MAG: LytR/AlgR family response regulator transcription factor [Gammaproteobacteria bacterium]
MRVLIADDEPVAVERLELALSCIPEAELVGVARSGKEALSLIRELQPDVAILDVQMPGQTGFGVLSGLRPSDRVPEVIFVTAYESHAVKAFEIHAVEYLLKPVPFERFRDALRRARERLHARAADSRFAELQEIISALSAQASGHGRPDYERDLWVRERDGMIRIPIDSIDLFEAAGDYVIAHAGETTHLLSDSISALQGRLDPASHLRVHRSAIVNLQRVRSLRRRGRRGLSLTLQSGRQVAVGPSYADVVLEAVNAKRWR